jgi:N-acetylneuraminic acid mutarotase
MNIKDFKGILMICVLTCAVFTEVKSQIWEPVQSMPYARNRAVSFELNEKGYVTLGQTQFQDDSRSLWEYNPETDTWSQKADYGGGDRTGAFSFVIDEEAYVGAGGDDTLQEDFWKYDPIANVWEQKADFGGGPRGYGIAFSINGIGYAGLGLQTSSRQYDFWKYMPDTDEWIQLEDVPFDFQMYNSISFSLNGKGYFGLGLGFDLEEFNNYASDRIFQYDPETDSWLEMNNFEGAPRLYANSFINNNEVYAGFGRLGGNGAYLNDLWRYNEDSDTWEELSDISGINPRGRVSTFTLNGYSYVGNGLSFGENHSDFYVLNGLIEVNAFPVSDLLTCDEVTPQDSSEFFDLTVNEDQLVGDQTEVEVSYFTSIANAIADTNAISMPTDFANSSNPQTIYVRVESTIDTTVFDTTSFDLIVHPLPGVESPEPFVICDEDYDGFGTFDLTLKDNELTNGDSLLSASYFESSALAEEGDSLSQLQSPYTNSLAFSDSVWARVENVNTGCYSVAALPLVVNIPPVDDSSVSNIQLCDSPFGGVAEFDLTINSMEVLNGQDPDTYDVLFFADSTEAVADSNSIVTTTEFLNTSNPQTIYVGILNTETGCYVGGIQSFEIQVLETPEIVEEPDDIFIDEGDENGSAIFDLTTIEADVLGSQDPDDLVFNYFENSDDAGANDDEIVTPDSYQNIENPQTIYYRLTNAINNCYIIGDFEIETDGVLGIDEKISQRLKVFPNPAKEFVTLQSDFLRPQTEISVFNGQGKVVRSPFQLNTKKNQMQIDLSGLNPGVYFIKIEMKDALVLKKIMIH